MSSINGGNSGLATILCTLSNDKNDLYSPFTKQREIALLLNSQILSEDNIDKAYEIAKTIENFYDCIYAISDISIAYSSLNTIEGFKKAYQATLDVSDLIDVKDFLQELSVRCRELYSDEATRLAEKIEQFLKKYNFG